MKVYNDIFEQHANLVLLRSQRAREEIAASLSKKHSQPATVGVYQMRNVCGGENAKVDNLNRMLTTIELAKQKGIQILSFPEMCLPGYFTTISGTVEEARFANHSLADSTSNSSYLKQLQKAAANTRMVLAFGFSEKEGDTFYNSIGVIDSDGTWLGTRRKNPLCASPYEMNSFTEPPLNERTAVFKTSYATIGISNCFDGEFPESIRSMRLAGAELLLWCNAATCDPSESQIGFSHRINHSASYAQANKMWVACCNSVGKNVYGTSVLVSYTGDPLVILPPDQEALGVTTIDLSITKDWEPWRSRINKNGYIKNPT